MTDEINGGDCVGVIRSLNRICTPRGIEGTYTVELGDVPQVVSVRGMDRANPVIVFVHGGPGTPLAPTAWMWQRPVEDFFTVVHYDQRGAGRSTRLSSDDVRDTMVVDRYVQDLVELVDWLRAELDMERVTLAGHSWGTVVATKAVVERPELFDAYVGVGQVVSVREGEEVSYRRVSALAAERHEPEAIEELSALAPYPGDSLQLARVGIERRWAQQFGGFAAYRQDCDYFMDGVDVSPDYDEDDAASNAAGNQLTAEALLPQLLDVDLSGVRAISVPVVQILGRHDLMTPAGPVARWMERLRAPYKAVEWFEHSAHMAMYEEPGRFLMTLVQHVRRGHV